MGVDIEQILDQTTIDHLNLLSRGDLTHAEIDTAIDALEAAAHSHANMTALNNVSGVNTGDQDLTSYDDHIADITGNPHEVNAAQVGALALDGSNKMTAAIKTTVGTIESDIVTASGNTLFSLKTTDPGSSKFVDDVRFFEATDGVGYGFRVKSFYPGFFGAQDVAFEGLAGPSPAVFDGLRFMTPGFLGLVAFATKAAPSTYVGINPGANSFVTSSGTQLNIAGNGGALSFLRIGNTGLIPGTGAGAHTIGTTTGRYGITYLQEDSVINWGNTANSKGTLTANSLGEMISIAYRASAANAVAHISDTNTAFTHAGSKIHSFRNATVEKLYIDKDGGLGQAAGCSNGFYGATPVTKPTALTTADATALDGTIGTNDTVTDNLRTRINELEAKIQALGLLS